MAGEDAVYRELVRLRRGRGLQAARLRSRLGPHLSTACALRTGDPDPVIRQKLAQIIGELAGDFPPDLKIAINVALAIDVRARFPTLEARESWLADQLKCSVRSARRRVVEASGRLAEVLTQTTRADAPADPDQGWFVSHLSALLCLDTAEPVLYEERTIVATRDGLSEIRTRFSLPRDSDPQGPPPDLVVTPMHGVRLRHAERLGRSHFRHTLALPRALRHSEIHEYRVMYRLPRGQRMLPHFAFVPLTPCSSFQVRVRFDPENPPQAVWRLDRVPQPLLDEEAPSRTYLDVDEAGDLNQSFTDLMQGFGYGVGWRPGRAGGPAVPAPRPAPDPPSGGVSGPPGNRQRENPR